MIESGNIGFAPVESSRATPGQVYKQQLNKQKPTQAIANSI